MCLSEPVRQGNYEIVKIRDCLGGDRIVEVDLPCAVGREALARVDGIVSCVLLETAPKPFFRAEVPKRFALSGVLGERRVRFTVRLAVRDHTEQTVRDAVRRLLGLP